MEAEAVGVANRVAAAEDDSSSCDGRSAAAVVVAAADDDDDGHSGRSNPVDDRATFELRLDRPPIDRGRATSVENSSLAPSRE